MGLAEAMARREKTASSWNFILIVWEERVTEGCFTKTGMVDSRYRIYIYKLVGRPKIARLPRIIVGQLLLTGVVVWSG